MKSFKTASLLSRLVGLVGLMVSGTAISGPGQGWDTFGIGQGEPIPHSEQSNAAHAGGGAPGQGWDVMRTGGGQPLVYEKSHPAASSGGSAGKGWDTFHLGLGDPWP